MKNNNIEIIKKIFVARYDFYWEYKINKPPFVVYSDYNKLLKKNLIKLTDEDIEKHIEGKKILGISPFIDDKNVKWCAVDIDAHITDESLVEENKIYEQNKKDCFLLYHTLKEQGYTCLVDTCDERGWHIYLLQNKTDAQKCRKFLAYIQQMLFDNPNKHEVFPKQNKLSETPKGFGNQLKLHLSKHPVKLKHVCKFNVEENRKLNIYETLEELQKIDVKNLKEIEIDDNEYKELGLNDFISSKNNTYNNNRFIPEYCAFIEEGCKDLKLPHSSVTRHHFIDPNVSAYTWDWKNDKKKREIRKKYLTIQNKQESALQNWNVHNFNCVRFKDFCESHNKDKNVKICIEKCKSCQDLFNKHYYKVVDEENKNKIKINKKLQKTFQNKVNDLFELGDLFHKHQPLFFDKSHIWMMWNDEKFKYEICDEIDILNKIDTYLGYNPATIKPSFRNQILDVLKRIGRRNIPPERENKYIQFKDNVVDLQTGRITKAKPSNLITNPIPWDIGATDETPVMDKIIISWVGKKYLKMAYQIIAYCCLPSYPLQRIFTFVGKGSNGKSKFMELIDNFVGDENVCTASLDRICVNRFESAKLYRKTVCMMGETNFTAMANTDELKKLSGGDKVDYEFKNKTPFSAWNTAKLLISTNSLPQTIDKTKGFYRRWIIMFFNNSFNEKIEIMDTIPEIEYNNLANKVTKILPELLRERWFDQELGWEEKKEIYEKTSNPLSSFIEEYCEQYYDYKVPRFEFYQNFMIYLNQQGQRIQTKLEVKQNMEKESFELRTLSASRTVEEDGELKQKQTTWQYFMGLRLKTSKEEVKEESKENELDIDL